MAIRVRPREDPRIIVGINDDKFTVQEIHDQITEWSDEPHAHAFKKLIVTTGQDTLDDTTNTVLTSWLQNGKFAFDPNIEVHQSGTVTTQDTTGVRLIDSAATFVSNGVDAGDAVVNFTDKSVQSVLKVISETEEEFVESKYEQLARENNWEDGELNEN